MRSINIFTDASITKTIYNEAIGCSGAICSEDNSLSKFYISRDSTNNISEITAIKLGVLLALENRNLFDVVNIWSDSQWSVFGLTKWIKSWMNNSVNYILKNSSGEDVKNQQLFLSIVKLIVDNNLRVNFYHIKGHVDTRSIKSVNHAISVFNTSNNTTISRSNMYAASNMNNLVDNTTRNMLKDISNETPQYFTRGVAIPIISKEDMIIYYKLVTLGGNKIYE